MFSGTVAVVIVLACIALFIGSMHEICDLFGKQSAYWFIPIALSVAIGAMVIVGVSHSLSRNKPDAKTCYEIKDIGTPIDRVQVAYVKGELFNTTTRFNVTLNNPDTYCLEEQTYKNICDGWCLFTIGQDPTYKIALRPTVGP